MSLPNLIAYQQYGGIERRHRDVLIFIWFRSLVRRDSCACSDMVEMERSAIGELPRKNRHQVIDDPYSFVLYDLVNAAISHFARRQLDHGGNVAPCAIPS